MRTVSPPRLLLAVALLLACAAAPAAAQNIQDSQITSSGATFWTTSTESDPGARIWTTYNAGLGNGLLAFPGSQTAVALRGMGGMAYNLPPAAGYVYAFTMSPDLRPSTGWGIRTICVNLHTSRPCFFGGWVDVPGTTRLRPVAVFKGASPEFEAGNGDRFALQWLPDPNVGSLFRYYVRRQSDTEWVHVATGPGEPNALPFQGQTFHLAAEFPAEATTFRGIVGTVEFAYNP